MEPFIKKMLFDFFPLGNNCIKDENNMHIVKECVSCTLAYWDIQCIFFFRNSMPSFGQVRFSM